MTAQMLLGFVIGALAEGLVMLLFTIFSDDIHSKSKSIWIREYTKIRNEYNDALDNMAEGHIIQLSYDEIQKIINGETDLKYIIVYDSANSHVGHIKIFWYIEELIGEYDYEEEVQLTVDLRPLKRKEFIAVQEKLYECRYDHVKTKQIEKQIKARIYERNTERD